ncbi:GPI transamidase component PIG-S [Carica papaya]|uniref:GPI transamidase component PIG-S n=1 Tax=Carica papaya TaxID=3649 RepID=UPI000B8CA40D|nr:GPI transamidase component PIG-S [Carica papaya]
MAEILEPPSSAHGMSESSEKPQEHVLDLDPKTMRTTKPGVKRLILTFSVLFSFLLGLPFLWKSVEIYRSPLPFHDIDSLSAQIEKKSVKFPCNFHAIFVGFDSIDPDRLRSTILNEITKLIPQTPQCGSCGSSNNFSLSVTVQESHSHCVQNLNHLSLSCSYRCGSIKVIDFESDDDEAIDAMLRSVLAGCSNVGGKVHSVVVLNGHALEEVRAVVGKHRHAWVVGKGLEERKEAVAAWVAEIFTRFFVNGGREEGMIHGEFMPVGADGSIVLSFNLLNADPRDWVYDWDFHKIDETLAPVIEALGPIANISVESQVLYHTPKASFASWDEKLQSYVFSTKDLPFFVNSNEWHLDTSIAAGGRSKILQFVVYIPSAKECPLLLQLPDGEISKTNGFISPMWGGIIVWNPTNCLKGSESNHPTRHTIPSQDLEQVFEVFVGQVRQLFGLKSDSSYHGVSGTINLLYSERGFTEWEMDFLLRQHTCFNLHSCATTLDSLSRLVQSLPRMIIMDEIGKQVKFSLEAAKQAQSNTSLGVYESSAVSSREARSLAEDAFFHPSIMSVSYYSFEHCFAVYSPFFLPVAMHVVLAALREWKRYRQENTKYLAWKAKVKKA